MSNVAMTFLWLASALMAVLFVLSAVSLVVSLRPNCDPNRLVRLAEMRVWIIRWLIRPFLWAAIGIVIVQLALPRGS